MTIRLTPEQARRLTETGAGGTIKAKRVSRQGGRRKSATPRSQVKNALRQVWLRSRERLAALKRDGYTCQRCGAKQSKAKGREIAVEVHHRHGIPNWDAVIDAVYQHLLCSPEELETVCKCCHNQGHGR